MNTFKEDLEVGKKSESIVLKIIQKKYPQAFGIEGYCKAYDIFIPEISQGVEVKRDYKSIETGNIVVEIRMNGKLSALSTTKAHIWVFDVHDVYAFFNPDRIRDCIIENNLDMKTFIGCGDTKPKDVYLIKRDLLFKYSNSLMKKKDETNT